MKKEFKLAKGWTVFLWIFAPILIIGFGWMGISPFFGESKSLPYTLFFTISGFGLVSLMVLALIEAIKGKLIIERDRIIDIGIFKTKILPTAAIYGFKQNDKYLYLIPFPNSNYKKIKISSYIGNYNELLLWAEQTLKNLDKEELINDKKEILANEEFGSTIQEREQKLNKTKKLTRTLNIIATIIAVSLWAFPHYYKLQVLLCASFPIIALVFYKKSNGLIKLDEKPNSVHPNLLATIMFPSIALMIRALMDFTIFSFTNFWTPTFAILAAFGIFIFRDSGITYNYKTAQTYLTIFGMLIFSGIYTYGVIITTNAILDQSQPQTYKAKILDKRISSGKTTYYYFTLSPWGPQKETEEVYVTREVFENKTVGDSSMIYFNNGLYKIPYYLVLE